MATVQKIIQSIVRNCLPSVIQSYMNITDYEFIEYLHFEKCDINKYTGSVSILVVDSVYHVEFETVTFGAFQPTITITGVCRK